MNLEQEFPQDPDLCYLNHAAVAPWPARARDAAIAFAQENCSRGARNYPAWMALESRLREKLAMLVNAPSPWDIALVKNTSEALSMVAGGIDWQAGDEVVITDQEFPSNRIVWEALAHQGVQVVQAQLGDMSEPEAAIVEAMNERTRLVSVSSVQYGTGLRLDLAPVSRACRERGAFFCVDAIQSIGAEPLDVQALDIDFAMADGHKWMLGPEGLALFYIRRPLQAQLRLLEYGWHMVEHRGDYDRHDWEPAQDARRFECGSPNMLAAHVLDASVGLLLEYGLENVRADIARRMVHLEEKLACIDGLEPITPADPQQRGGIYTFRLVGHDDQALQCQLMGQGVVCAYRGGGIRFSPHFYTPLETLDEAVKRLRQALP